METDKAIAKEFLNEGGREREEGGREGGRERERERGSEGYRLQSLAGQVRQLARLQGLSLTG